MRIVVRNTGDVGLVYDQPAHDLPPEAWTAGQNVAFRNGSVEKVAGAEQVYGTLSGTPYGLLQAVKGAAYYILYPTLAACYVTDGTTHKDITKAATTYSADADIGWTGGVIGGVPVLNNGVDPPQEWDRDFATPGLLTDLTNWPASTLCRALRVFKNYLIAMDLTESGTRYEDVVRWSHPAEPGAVPSTWDYTDDTKDAGRTALSDTPGAVIDGKTLGNAFILYKERGVWGMQETGDRRIFRFWPIFEQISAMSRDCIEQIAEPTAKRHIVLTTDADVILHDGSGAESIARRKWRTWLQNNIDTTYLRRSFVTIDRAKREAWICVPTSGATAPNMALVWNMQDNTIGIKELNATRAALWELQPTSVAETWDGDSGTWDADTTVWNQPSAAEQNLLVFTSGSKILRAGVGNQFDGADMTAYVERQGLAMIGKRRDGSPIVDLQSRKLARRIWLEMESTGPVDVYLVTQEQKGGAASYSSPQSFDPASQKYVDVHGSGRLLGIKVQSTDDISWKLSGYEIEFEKLGTF